MHFDSRTARRFCAGVRLLVHVAKSENASLLIGVARKVRSTFGVGFLIFQLIHIIKVIGMIVRAFIGKEKRQPHCREPSPRSNHIRTSPVPKLSASSAEKAHSLPRYVPVERRYDFNRWIDSNGELVLHKVKDVATGLVSAPLGCTYDSALDTFVFTRQDALFTTSGQMLKCARIANGASFPYCSAFGVSPSGMLMACDRANSRMVLFRFGEESVSEDAVITDDVFDRMIGESGVEKEVRRLKERARRRV
ncbi:hypothetical protein TELCIR_11600 [Teladorsagia circumcincta]|uniref:Uncharacterized protein n=1 Tax=Teladorsagia circumcincta TaxID=45464 RepID=A0A2G9U8T0_TELCI|nr:hypothetical protein TELCIR_11600 [Teladorsagia circumcincta]